MSKLEEIMKIFEWTRHNLNGELNHRTGYGVGYEIDFFSCVFGISWSSFLMRFTVHILFLIIWANFPRNLPQAGDKHA